MKRMFAVLVVIAATVATGAMPGGGMAVAEDESPFRFRLEETQGHRGVGVQGYVYNTLPWRITNVRLQIDSIDANGTRIASAPGWVVGDVASGGRGYFYVPVSTPAATYRPSVQAFDKVMREAPASQAP